VAAGARGEKAADSGVAVESLSEAGSATGASARRRTSDDVDRAEIPDEEIVGDVLVAAA